jgi:hypothetical protein
MIYTHVMVKGPSSVPSPLDLLDELTPLEIRAALENTHRLQAAL